MSKKQAPKQRSVPVWVWVVLAAVVLAVAGAAVTLWRPAGQVATGFPAEISVAEAAAQREQGALILDVRELDEWQAGHIPGATLIPLGQLAQRTAELPADQEIVVVCRSGNRSAQARDLLKEAGFEQVTSMAGGMIDWAQQGLPVETGP